MGVAVERWGWVLGLKMVWRSDKDLDIKGQGASMFNQQLMPLISHHDFNPNQYCLSSFTSITCTATKTPRWALTSPANTPYPLVGSIKKCLNRVHESGLADPFSDLILGDAIWVQSIMAYQEFQKTQYNNTNTSLQSLLFWGLANRESDEARNIFKEQAMHYVATNDVHLFEHILNLYDWVSLVFIEECGMVDQFLVRLTWRRLI